MGLSVSVGIKIGRRRRNTPTGEKDHLQTAAHNTICTAAGTRLLTLIK